MRGDGAQRLGMLVMGRWVTWNRGLEAQGELGPTLGAAARGRLDSFAGAILMRPGPLSADLAFPAMTASGPSRHPSEASLGYFTW